MQVIRRKEALAAGLSPYAIRRRVKSGKWQEPFPGVYLPSTQLPTWEQRVIAGCEWSDGVASYRTAGRLWKFPDFGESDIELTTSRDLRSASGDVIIHRARLERLEKTFIGVIPVTSPSRTVLDVAGILDAPPLVAVVHDVLRRDLAMWQRLNAAVEHAGRGRRGIAELRKILKEGLDSELERMLGRLLKKAHLPPACPQHRVGTSAGECFDIDFAFPNERIAIEVDGWAFHSDHDAFLRDRRKWRELAKLGWTVLCFTYEDVKFFPRQVIEDITAALANNAVA